MPQNFEPGDYLVFQLESGFALLRILEVEQPDGDSIWHVAAYRDLFLDTESAEQAIEANSLTLEIPHTALTNRAFRSTPVARLANRSLEQDEAVALEKWHSCSEQKIHDRSIRLLLGLR